MPRVVAWSALALVISGCVVFGPDAQAHRLVRDAREAVERRDLDAAWRSLVRVEEDNGIIQAVEVEASAEAGVDETSGG